MQPRTTWMRLVIGSAALVVGAGIAIGAWWVLSRHERITTYAVRGQLDRIALDLGDADLAVVGGGDQDSVAVRRTDRYAFGRPPAVRREVRGRVLHIRARCAANVVSVCSAGYRLVVPDNVPLDVKTRAGDVSFDGYRGSAQITTTTGDIDVRSYCGFSLVALTDSAHIDAAASCPTERLILRSRSGRVHAVVPPGRYRVDASTDAGRRHVAGLTSTEDAPFQIQALSSTGDVDVEASR